MSAPKGVPMPTAPHLEAPGGSESRDWMVLARCRDDDIDAELFFTNSRTRGQSSTRQIEAAQRICFQCPVINECAQYADANEETWGVWGGTNYDPKSSKDKRWRDKAMGRMA